VIGDMWLGGWGWLVGLASLAFWVLLIIAIVALIRGHPRGPIGHGTPTALLVLEERYARGEISREEFVERRSVLRRQGSTGPDPGEPD
jgi:putative membrane protein